MKKIIYLILIAVVYMNTSCEPTYVKEYNWAYPVAGDWTVTSTKFFLKDIVNGPQNDSIGEPSDPFEIKSYNSSFGKDSIWIDDYGKGVDKSANYGNFWTMKFKAAVNMNSKTFGNGTATVTNAIPDYGIGIKILNGKIVGNDSVYFEIQFEDDTTPFGITYREAGHRTTSYEEYTQQ